MQGINIFNHKIPELNFNQNSKSINSCMWFFAFVSAFGVSFSSHTIKFNKFFNEKSRFHIIYTKLLHSDGMRLDINFVIERAENNLAMTSPPRVRYNMHIRQLPSTEKINLQFKKKKTKQIYFKILPIKLVIKILLNALRQVVYQILLTIPPYVEIREIPRSVHC